MNTLFYLVNIGLPLLLILATFLFSFYFEQRILNKLQKIANRTGWSNNEFFFKSFRGIFILWFVLLGIWSATFLLPLSPQGNRFFQKFLLATFLGSGTLLFSRLAVSLIKFYGSREEGSPLTSLFENLTRLIVFSLGILIILQSVGIAITPLLTALGVGGVSIGLALQNTLANLFSGLNIITSKKVRPGDYIKLETGEEGYVRDIAWRYTIIREYYDNLIVIPNSKLVSATFKNYTLPNKEMLIPIECSVSYGSDLDKVEAVTLEVAKEVMNYVPGGVANFEPFLRYHKFDYFSINFTIYLKVKKFIDHLIIRHEFLKRLYRRYQWEGIKIPFPIQAGYLKENQQKIEPDFPNTPSI